MTTDKERVNNIFLTLRDKCGGSVLDMQGACATLAMHIYLACNCTEVDIIGGYLTSSTGWRRSHWWIEKNGVTYDPMGDCYTCEPGFKRVVEFGKEYDEEVDAFDDNIGKPITSTIDSVKHQWVRYEYIGEFNCPDDYDPEPGDALWMLKEQEKRPRGIVRKATVVNG